MARIYLDARNITDEPAGVARYARSLIPRLVDAEPGHEYVVIRHRSNQKPIDVPSSAPVEEIAVNCDIDGLKNLTAGHRDLEAAVARGGAPDLYHSLFHLVPMGIRRVVGDAPVVTTLHDFVWLDHPVASQPTLLKAGAICAFARVAIPASLRRSDRVIAISEPTRRRALDFVDDEKLVTIPQGVDEVFFDEPPTDFGALDELVDDGERPWIAAIGNEKSYKNLSLLVEAFSGLVDDGVSARLVLLGDCEGLSCGIDPSVSEWVTLTGVVEDRVLRRIVGQSQIFVFPSKVEGFGLPILEAMAMGVPTVVSNREPMRSIAGEAGLLFDPDDAKGLGRLIERVLEDERLAARLARRGKKRAQKFRWEKTARRTLEVYEALL